MVNEAAVLSLPSGRQKSLFSSSSLDQCVAPREVASGMNVSPQRDWLSLGSSMYLIVSHLCLITLKCEVRKKSPCSASSHGGIQGKVSMWKFSRKCPTRYKVHFRIQQFTLKMQRLFSCDAVLL